jgi:hypothetical protein
VKLFEKAFIEQAGIVVTRLDEKRSSVACNDALPRKPLDYRDSFLSLCRFFQIIRPKIQAFDLQNR